jgi:hypothetical protein
MRKAIIGILLAALMAGAPHAQTYESSLKVPDDLLLKAREFLVRAPKECPFHWNVFGREYYLDRGCVRNLAGTMGLHPDLTLKVHTRLGPNYDILCDRSDGKIPSVSEEECLYTAAFGRAWRKLSKPERCSLQYYHGEYGCYVLQPKGFTHIQPGEGPRFVDGRTP